MANLKLKFLRGPQSNLPAAGTDGYFYLATDTRRLYTSVDGKVVPVNEGVTTVANLDALTSITGVQAGDFFYCTEENILAVYNGQKFVQINPDTGVTSAEAVGDGNAVTNASYDPATRKLTLTKGETFATKAYVGVIPGTATATDVIGYIQEKTANIATDTALEELTGRVSDLETASAKHVEKETGKSLIADTEIARLAAMSDDANKVEESETNGNIKIDGEEVVVYTHPDKHAIADVDGLQAALDGKQAAGNYAAEEHTHTTAEVTDLDTTIKGYDYATKTELGDVDKKFADYTKTADLPTDLGDFTNDAGYIKTADVNTELDKKADKSQVATDIANAIAPLATTEALNGVKATAEAATTPEEVDAQIDAKIGALNLGTTYEPIGAEDRAKTYIDGKFTDANLAQYTTEQEVKDIVDGVIAEAADSETYNSLTKLVDYIDTHGGEATQMAQAIGVLEGKVEVIEKKPAYDISATQISNWDNEVGAKALAETKTTTTEVKDQIEAYGYATTGKLDEEKSAREAADTELTEAIETAKTDAANQAAVVLSESQKYTDTAKAAAIADAEGKVNALASNVYTKEQTYTQAEVDALIEEALSWGTF